MDKGKVIQSYVWHGDKCFFVSTINRASSAYMCDGMYTETMAWTFDISDETIGDEIVMASGPLGSIFQHIEMCKQLHETGTIEEIK